MQAVQLVIADAAYLAALREALTRTGPWQVACRQAPDVRQKCVLVLDEGAFHQLPLPVPNPERVVLITRKDPEHLSLAWEAGIVSVVSQEDPTSTVLLAVMAAALRVPRAEATTASGISPSPQHSPAPIPADVRPVFTKRSKNQ